MFREKVFQTNKPSYLHLNAPMLENWKKNTKFGFYVFPVVKAENFKINS